MKHILSVDQFTKTYLTEIIGKAGRYRADPEHSGIAKGKILTNLFYEPSTRTSSSFYSAMVRMGGSVIPINDVSYSSVSKGETLEDTIRTMQCYSDLIVLRHKLVGSADRAAAVADVPIINAGDGVGEHPTQALLDLFTILSERGWQPGIPIDELMGGLTVTMMGDLKHGRTVKSLSKLLRLYDVQINWVSPDTLEIPSEFLRRGDYDTAQLDEVIRGTDVLYVTRVQRERLPNDYSVDQLTAIVDSYVVTPQDLDAAKPTMVLMHPLPRTTELPTSLDADPRAAYFRQMKYGLFMRMAAIHTVLE